MKLSVEFVHPKNRIVKLRTQRTDLWHVYSETLVVPCSSLGVKKRWMKAAERGAERGLGDGAWRRGDKTPQ